MSGAFNKLSPQEKHKFWEDIGALLNEALATCAVDFPRGLTAEIHEYIDHNELGLAWETLCESLIEFDTVPGMQTQRLFLEAGRRMGFDQSTNSNYDRWLDITTHFGGNS